MLYDSVYSIDDEPANDADADGQERNQNADGDIPKDHLRTGLPNEMEHGRNIFKCSQTICPCAGATLRALCVTLVVCIHLFRTVHCYKTTPGHLRVQFLCMARIFGFVHPGTQMAHNSASPVLNSPVMTFRMPFFLRMLFSHSGTWPVRRNFEEFPAYRT